MSPRIPFPIRSCPPASGNAPAGFSPSRSEPLCPVAVSSETGANSPVGMDDSRPGLSQHPGDTFRDAYRGVSLIQPDLQVGVAEGRQEVPTRSGHSACRERDHDISAQTFGWAQFLRYRNG